MKKFNLKIKYFKLNLNNIYFENIYFCWNTDLIRNYIYYRLK